MMDGYSEVKSRSDKFEYKPGTGSNRYPPAYESLLRTECILRCMYAPEVVWIIAILPSMLCILPEMVGVPRWCIISSPTSNSRMDGLMVVGLFGATIPLRFK